MATPREQKIINELESMSSLDDVRQANANYKWGHKGTDNYNTVSNWIAAKEAALRDEREEESLSISRKALKISEEANRIAEKAKASARCANFIAIIALVTAFIATIITVLTKN